MELRNQIIYISKKVLNSIKNFEFNFETTICIFDKELNVLYAKSNDENQDLCKLVIEESVENNAFILSSLQNTTVKTKNKLSGKDFSVISSPFHENKNKELQGYVGIFTTDDSENFKMISEMLANQISYELHVYREKLSIEEIIKTDRSSLFTRESQHKVDLRIIQNITQGLKDKEIADNLHISVSTVRNHINKLFEELGVSSRSQLISLHYENKLHEILHEVKMENRIL
ncbi:response regulator transcription factor [Peribacillus castrilensis]|uniref:LuxR family transcriptional regulator n=1 Tax=Peribacillus simplex TaxID=1478 RepID=A0AAN2PKW4_9BACI|nr:MULTISPECIES: LuxR C-terminal-related transcriptional regulator [Bacillaceae]MCP1092291.1 LuxR C-terminal-related transcriptional regulator [Bacillaceae bacterium OS4b]MBD8588764.1 response regulator transcription factor [Peribacillus simplex]MCF7624374.1 LuxR C-terminal-related transcriptional regulator [Peribacillus frigoritolerans]MCP1154940.1 LuxR C-terminal-related transcriptional regulator [Peribacillus frigoritolerans]MCT1391774.1 LuxR C-terminal-related transcriptional regulator [Pe